VTNGQVALDVREAGDCGVSAATRIVVALRDAGRPLTEEELAAATRLRAHDVEKSLEVLVSVMQVRRAYIGAWQLISDPVIHAAEPDPTDELAEPRKRKRRSVPRPGGFGEPQEMHVKRVAAARKAWETRRARKAAVG